MELSHPNTTATPDARARRFCAHCGKLLANSVCGCVSPPAQPAPKADTGTVSLRTALRLYFVLLATVVAASAATWFSDSAEGEIWADFFASGAMSAVVCIAVAISWRRLRGPLTTLGPVWCYLAAPIVGLVTFAVASGACHLLQQLVGLENLQYASTYLEAGYSWPLIVMLVAVQPAVFEELAFRGVIGSAMGNLLDARDAILATAMMFAILHLSPASFPHLFVVGLALGVLRYVSRSLYPCMILHFTHNGLVLLTEYNGGSLL